MISCHKLYYCQHQTLTVHTTLSTSIDINHEVAPQLVIPISFQEDNTRMREEVESLHRKFDALKRFASQKKLRLPVEFEQY